MCPAQTVRVVATDSFYSCFFIIFVFIISEETFLMKTREFKVHDGKKLMAAIIIVLSFSDLDTWQKKRYNYYFCFY